MSRHVRSFVTPTQLSSMEFCEASVHHDAVISKSQERQRKIGIKKHQKYRTVHSLGNYGYALVVISTTIVIAITIFT